MACFAERDEVFIGGSGVPGVVQEPPMCYGEFQPKATSECIPTQNVNTVCPPSPPSCTKLCTLLNDMQDVARFAKHSFLKPRMITLVNFKEAFEKNKTLLEVAENSLESLDVFIKTALNNISTSVCDWEKRKKYYTTALNTVDSSPCAQLCSGCPQINRQIYTDLLEKMTQMCCKIERESKLAELQLKNMEELGEAIRIVIQLYRSKVDCYSGNVKKLFDEQYVKIYCILEKAEYDAKKFKSEWGNECGQLNAVSAPLYTAKPPTLRGTHETWTPPQCPQLQGASKCPDRTLRNDQAQPPACKTKRPTVPVENNLMGSPVYSFTNHLLGSTGGHKGSTHSVNDIVGRYNCLQRTIRDEMNNMKDQQQLITKNEADLGRRSSKQ